MRKNQRARAMEQKNMGVAIDRSFTLSVSLSLSLSMSCFISELRRWTWPLVSPYLSASLSLSLWSLVFLCLSPSHFLTRLLEAIRKFGRRILYPPSSISLMISYQKLQRNWSRELWVLPPLFSLWLFVKINAVKKNAPKSSGASLLHFPFGYLFEQVFSL